MNVALVENAKKHVDHQNRRDDEGKLRALRLLKRSRLAGVCTENGRRQSRSLLPGIDYLSRRAQAKTGLSPTAVFAGLALPVTMDSGRVVVALPLAAVRLAGFRPAILGVLSVLPAGVAVTCTVGVRRPNEY